MIVFDGITTAKKKEELLKQKVIDLKEQYQTVPQITAILFEEDAGSVLYTQKKQEAAHRVGIGYQVKKFSINQPLFEVITEINILNTTSSCTGIIIQKPTKKTWRETFQNQSKRNKHDLHQKYATFSDWWQTVTRAINPEKDVDGLHPETLEAVKKNIWQHQKKVLPATCKAVLEILQQAEGSIEPQAPQAENAETGRISEGSLSEIKYLILGRSDILGQPLYFELKNRGLWVEMIGHEELTARSVMGKYLLDADVIVTATGKKHLIQASMIKQDVVVIDAGEPYPDVDFQSIKEKVCFITPVPGGVGPMTVVCLLENCVELFISQRKKPRNK